MNHLRELLEGGVFLADEIVAIEYPHRPVYLERLEEEAICFSIDADVFFDSGLKVIPELAELPYPVCWFEVTADLIGNGQQVWGFAVFRDDESLRYTAFLRHERVWSLSIIASWSSWSPGDDRAPDFCWGTNAHATQIAGRILVNLGAFITAMNCKNVGRELVAPNARLQRARQKRGKLPLFSYWTLRLKGHQIASESQGGTHSSPRLHLRRGHPREYAPGLYTWVQPTVVGNMAAGLVHKDYEVRP